MKEPFFHFALLAVGFFVWFGIQNPSSERAPKENEIVVSESLFSSLRSQFEAKLNRPPSEAEANALIDRYVRNEILVREARDLGLDQGDGIVRNRLVQKMGFLITSAAQSAVPDDETLQQHLLDNAERFQLPATVAFDQVTIKAGVSEELSTEVLDILRAGEEPPSDYVSYFLPPEIGAATQAQVDGVFGSGFYAQLEDLPQGTWAGPVQSGYGMHLIRIRAWTPAELPPLDTVRDKVTADWRGKLAEQLTEAQENAMMDSYIITRPDSAELGQWLSQ